MENIYQLWQQNRESKDLKLRYCDWNHRVKYVRIVGESSDGNSLIGVLATGEEVSFPKSSEFWHVYQDGDENQARAI